ncbi:MAG: group II truncated hemoglobin [Deltaproteobacteria bacterium]
MAEDRTPFDLIGGAAKVHALIERFYEVMFATEPALTQLHRTAPDGRVDAATRERFALFVIGWLGGPQGYIEQHGHPRLRMRHARVKVDAGMRDAWLRCMQQAMTEEQITGPVRNYLDSRFAEVADFMRNTEG